MNVFYIQEITNIYDYFSYFGFKKNYKKYFINNFYDEEHITLTYFSVLNLKQIYPPRRVRFAAI